MDNFRLALSAVDFQHALGVSDSSYRRAVEDLLGAGYLMMRNGKKNTMDFYTSPQPTSYVKKEYKKKVSDGGAAPVSCENTDPEPLSFEEEEYISRYSSSYSWEP